MVLVELWDLVWIITKEYERLVLARLTKELGERCIEAHCSIDGINCPTS